MKNMDISFQARTREGDFVEKTRIMPRKNISSSKKLEGGEREGIKSTINY